MSYFSNISTAVSTLIDGMKVTMGYFVRPRENVTLQYPDEVWPIPERNIGVGEIESYNTVRSKLHVNMDDCIGCKACERACPVDCIHIDTYRVGPEQDLGVTSNGTKIKLLTANFIIDMSECMFCDLCTPPCPENCITMTPDFQFIENDNLNTAITPEERWRDRDHLIYQFSKVPEEERQRLKAEAEEAAKAKELALAAKKAATEKAARDTSDGAETPNTQESSGEQREEVDFIRMQDVKPSQSPPEAVKRPEKDSQATENEGTELKLAGSNESETQSSVEASASTGLDDDGESADRKEDENG